MIHGNANVPIALSRRANEAERGSASTGATSSADGIGSVFPDNDGTGPTFMRPKDEPRSDDEPNEAGAAATTEPKLEPKDEPESDEEPRLSRGSYHPTRGP